MGDRGEEQSTTRRPTGMASWAIVMGEYVLREMRLALAPFAINPVQFGILDACYFGDANTVTSIARMLPVEPSAISRQADRLTTRGLLARRRQGDDRRVVTFSLTEEGMRLMPQLLTVVAEEEDKVAEGLSEDEQAALMATSRKIVENLLARRS